MGGWGRTKWERLKKEENTPRQRNASPAAAGCCIWERKKQTRTLRRLSKEKLSMTHCAHGMRKGKGNRSGGK